MWRLCLVLLLVGCAFGKYNGDIGDHIENITDHFYEALEGKEWIVSFGNPQCAFSNAFMVILKRESEDKHLYDCDFGFVDCPRNHRLCNYLGITKYPQVRYIKGETMYKYSGAPNDFIVFQDFLKGDYEDARASPLPPKELFFQEEDTLAEAFYVIQTMAEGYPMELKVFTLLFGIITAAGLYFWYQVLFGTFSPKKKKTQ